MPFSYGADELRAMLSQYGLVVDAKVIVDRETGKSRGFGFAQMMDAAQAQAAIAHLNGVFFEGKQMVVRIAGQQNRPGMGGAIGAGATGAPQAGVGAPVGLRAAPRLPRGRRVRRIPPPSRRAPTPTPRTPRRTEGGTRSRTPRGGRRRRRWPRRTPPPRAAAAAAGDPYAAYYVQQADMMAAAAGGVGVGVGDPYAAWGAAGAAPGTEAPPGVEAPPGTEAAAPAAPPPPAAVGGIAAGDPAAAPPPPPPPPGEMEQEMEM